MASLTNNSSHIAVMVSCPAIHLQTHYCRISFLQSPFHTHDSFLVSLNFFYKDTEPSKDYLPSPRVLDSNWNSLHCSHSQPNC